MSKEELKKEAQEQVNYCTPLYPECFIQGYVAGAEPRENKIADIKANCDLAIEGRDVKIKELEQKLEQTEKDIAISEYDREYNDYELVEVYKKVERLENQNKLLGERCNQLLKDKGNLTDKLQELKETLAHTIENDEVAYETLKLHDQEEIGILNSKIAGLEQQIEKMKLQYNYAFNQLCESREIVCLMLSQYKNKEEIDYSTRECGEKLLKQGVYKYD